MSSLLNKRFTVDILGKSLRPTVRFKAIFKVRKNVESRIIFSNSHLLLNLDLLNLQKSICEVDA
jgi:hypothetical protein